MLELLKRLTVATLAFINLLLSVVTEKVQEDEDMIFKDVSCLNLINLIRTRVGSDKFQLSVTLQSSLPSLKTYLLVVELVRLLI